jgi:hypothetical protein
MQFCSLKNKTNKLKKKLSNEQINQLTALDTVHLEKMVVAQLVWDSPAFIGT